MSWQMRALALYLRTTRKRRYRTAVSGARRLADPKGSSAPPSRLLKRCQTDRTVIDGFDVYVVHPRATTAAGGIVYLHGGAYVGEIQSQHWDLVADLAAGTGVAVSVPIYGLAPRHHAQQAQALMESVLTELTKAGPTYLVGDSAGGGLALAAAQSWLAAGRRPPAGLTLIAPWLDVTLTNPEIDYLEPHDPWLTPPGLRVAGRAWADGLATSDPWVSPIHGELRNLPPTDVYVGTRDIMLADCRLLRDRVPPERLRYHEEPGALHDYPLLPTPEGRLARRRLIGHIGSLLRNPRATRR